MQIIKRDGTSQDFDVRKILNAIERAFRACNKDSIPKVLVDKTHLLEKEVKSGKTKEPYTVEYIQDYIETSLMESGQFEVAKAYIIYREKHKESRLIKEKVDYIIKYSHSKENAATNSNTDANANNSMKNVASIEAEVFKDKNRLIQRQMMKDKLNILYPEVAKQYEKDLNNHIIYCHDESSSPIQKAYCGAYTLYPLMTEGVGNIDGITPFAPNDLQSFSGQVTNLVFSLSAQTKGAVGLGDYMVTINYYAIKEFGKNYYNKLDTVICNSNVLDWQKFTIEREIKKAFKQFIYGVNQPQGNRGYQSPFTNINIFDKYYFNALFGDFYYPDGTQPQWEAIDCLQRIFMQLMIDLRLIKPLTFPVVTMALLYDDEGYKDKTYAELCAGLWSKGSSHFLYHNDNADALSSCCRVSNKIDKNTFSSTTGMTGVMTGSCNVITLNINRIVQDFCKQYSSNWKKHKKELAKYLEEILERVYKYHIAYKTMLYELEEEHMITYSDANYLYIKKLFSTIGVIGYYEVAKFLGLEDNSEDYNAFMAFILSTISKCNKEHSIHDSRRPFIFNLEAVPGESLGVKLYNWDKEDGYVVPKDQNLYNCYFFNPWKEENILNKIRAHGGAISKASDGGQGCHINLCEHLSKSQYLKVMDIARIERCNYFTFNIPMSECEDCHHVVNGPITECPECHSHNIVYWTRIIGFLTKVNNWSKERKLEFTRRFYGKE